MKPTLYTLANGLRVVLEENHAAPVISLNALLLVGSADETDQEAGICHVIEHMLFKGTKNRKVGQIARDVEAAGGEINAYTSFDQTVYYINMAKRFVDEGLDILADAVQNPIFDAAELEREKEVILEEIRRERDNPGRHVGEILFQKAFTKHAYGRPIIGFQETVKRFSRDDLFRFYRRGYTPQNSLFIVVGDFDPEALLKKIEKVFGSFQSDGAPNLPRPAEPKQAAPLVEILSDNIQSTYAALGFHIPEMTHLDVPALDILSHILGGSTSSRLEQSLKEKKNLVHQIYAHAYTPKDPGLLLVGCQMNAAKALKAFEAFWEEIEKLKSEGPAKKELERAKLNIKSHEIYEKETVGGQAGKLAYFLATAGSLDFEEQYYERLQNIQPEEVAKVAQNYLQPGNLTAALLTPQKDFQKKWAGALTDILSNPPAAEGGPKTTRGPSPLEKPEKITLSNGIRVLVKEDPSLPIVAISACLRGGLLAETKAINGVHHLMAQCITKGTKHRGALEIAHAIEEMAGQLEGFSGKNSFGLRMEILSDFLPKGLDLFFEVLLEPAWDSQEIEKEKKLTLEAIKNQEDNLSSLAFHHFQKNLFGQHPYGMRMLGEKESVKKLNPRHLAQWHQKLVTPKNIVLSVVGDFNRREVLGLLEKKLAKLKRRPLALPKTRQAKSPLSVKKVFLHKKKEQAHVVLGFLAPSFKSPDYYTMTVLNNILSGMGGRLFVELRDKLSLAYSVTSVFQAGLDPGFFAIYLGTEPSKVPTALKAIEGELQKITTTAVPKEELEKTKNYLVGTYELELQRNSSLAQMFGFDELYGQGYKEVLRYPEKILGVTPKELLKAAKRYIHLEAYVLAVVQPERGKR